MHTSLHTQIMRRIYYIHVMRALVNRRMFALYTFIAMGGALAYTVSLSSVFANLMAVPVGQVGRFFYAAVTNTDAWTLLLLGGMMITFYVFIVGSRGVQVRTFSRT